MADAVETGPSCKGEYCIGYSTRTKARECSISFRTDLREYNNRFLSQSERERLARNPQLKMNWQNRCQKQMEIGIMCGDKPWTQADRKTVSMLYLNLGGTERRRVICSRNPHLKMDILTTVELWQIIESTFIRY